MNVKNEPVTLTGLIIAVVTVVISLVTAFGLNVSPDQAAAIIGTVSAVAALVGFLLARRQVTPTVNVAAQLDKTGTVVAGPAAAQTTGSEVVVTGTGATEVPPAVG